MEISNPRSLLKETDSTPKKNVERLFMGGGSSGIIFDVTKEGIEVNGYYEGSGYEGQNTKYSNLHSPVFIPWEEMEKVKQRALLPPKKRNIQPSFIDDPDEEYLKTLPIVHIYDRQYYIDGARRERRAVKSPQEVFKF